MLPEQAGRQARKIHNFEGVYPKKNLHHVLILKYYVLQSVDFFGDLIRSTCLGSVSGYSYIHLYEYASWKFQSHIDT